MTTASRWTDTNLMWRKSSFSADNGQCVEVANTLGALRDSKNPAGPALHANLAALLTSSDQEATTPGHPAPAASTPTPGAPSVTTQPSQAVMPIMPCRMNSCR